MRNWIIWIAAASVFAVTAFAQSDGAPAAGAAPAARPAGNLANGGPVPPGGVRIGGGGGDLQGYDPNDKRPAPRMADGHPDFSGIWTSNGGMLGRDKTPPFVPGGEKIYNLKLDPMKDDPTGFYCMPDGMPRIATGGVYPLRLESKAGLLMYFYEYEHFYRVIPTDGRAHTEDPEPSWMGDSVAKWDGDTLVIDTIGLTTHPDHRLDGNKGHSDALHITERLTRKNFSTILLDITVDDPKVFTKPYTSHHRLALRPTWNLLEYICEENNRTSMRGLGQPAPHYDGGAASSNAEKK